MDAIQTGDNFVNLHTLHQLTNSLKIAVATAQEFYIIDFSVLNTEVNSLRTGSLCLTFKLYNIFLSLRNNICYLGINKICQFYR